MGKYQQVTCVEEEWNGVGRKDPDGVVRLVPIGYVVRLLNSPPPAPPGGIVWRRPGEAGRVDGGRYLVWRCGASTVWTWTANHEHDGWACAGVVAWAEINPPAWEGESK